MIYHIYPEYKSTDPDAIRRYTIAQQTWKHLPWIERPIHDLALPRHFTEGQKKLPFVKDIFDLGCYGLDDDDIIVYTNSDIMVRSDACQVISAAMQDTDALYVFRRDFNHRIEAPVKDEDFIKGEAYAGSDMYAMRVAWWLLYRGEYPEMIIALEAWDAVIRVLIDQTNPKGKTELRDIICHERHNSFWERAENRYVLNGQLYVLRTARAWMQKRGMNPDNFYIKAV